MPRKKDTKMEYRVLELLRKQKTHYIGIRDLSIRAKIQPEEYEAFIAYIEDMCDAGLLSKRKSSVLLCVNVGIIKAEIVSISPNYSLARPVENEKEFIKHLTGRTNMTSDIYIPDGMEQGALPGDIVLLKPKYRGSGLPEGIVNKILVPGDWKFSGTLMENNDTVYIMPDKSMHVPLQVVNFNKAEMHIGDKVFAHVTQRGENRLGHQVEILQTFGSSEHAQSCCEALLSLYKIKREFDDAVLKQAREISAREISPKDLNKRLDLTEKDIFTIDSSDSKDLDDAVSLEHNEDKWFLGVHIADVSHYVTEQSPLDVEALTRGTSVYYADQVIPMLPKELSNGICSLNPGEIRLTFSALLTLDANGNLIEYDFKKSYIRSRVKGVYKEINAIIDGSAKQDILGKYDALIPQIKLMKELADILRERRFARGAMNIKSSDCKFVIEDGKVLDVEVREMGVSENIIEEFMLKANEAAASLGTAQDIPFLYRVHETPPEVKVEALHTLLKQLDITCDELQGNKPETMVLAKILESVQGTEQEDLINNQVLRTMSKAVYSEKNQGHYGLVLDNYSHFTSPIRRYPDLMIHRIMTSLLTGKDKASTIKRFQNLLQHVAKQSSETEVVAMNLERACDNAYKAEYMTKFINKILDGVISGVSDNGVFVVLPNTVSGFIHIRNMPKGVYALTEGIELVEQLSNKRYRIGQKVKLELINVTVAKGQVDFIFDDARPEGKPEIRSQNRVSQFQRDSKPTTPKPKRTQPKGKAKEKVKSKGKPKPHIKKPKPKRKP